MTSEQRADFYWAYFISREKTAKRLVNKGIMPQEDADRILERLYENTQEKDVLEFSAYDAYKQIIDQYLYRANPRSKLVSLTDIAREENPESPGYVIQSWLRGRNTLEFLRLWESKNNPNFSEQEYAKLFEAMKAPSFTVTPKQWISKTEAIGLVSKQGKGGGTFAHPDIAMDFQMWLKPELRLALVQWVRESKRVNRITALNARCAYTITLYHVERR